LTQRDISFDHLKSYNSKRPPHKEN